MTGRKRDTMKYYVLAFSKTEAKEMPHHAEMMEAIVEGDTISLRPELRPAFRTRYEELRETAPHVALLRYLMEHQELLLAPAEEVQP